MARPREFDENEVLDKALDLFWHKGYEATSIQELLQMMGISRGSLYDTFGDKHSLFLAALDRYRQRSHARFMQILNQPGSVKTAIAALFKAIVAEAVSDDKQRGCLLTNSTIELTPHDTDIAARTDSNRQWVEDAFYETLRRGQAQGDIPAEADPRALAQFLFNSLQGLRVVSKTTTDRQTLDNIVRVTLSALD